MKARLTSEILAPQEGRESREREFIVYAGTPVYRYNFWRDEEYMLKLSTDPGAVDLDRMQRAPVLKDHNRDADAVMGVIEEAWLADGQIRARARFADTPDVEPVWAKVTQGILRNLSVEASIIKSEKTKEKIDGLPVVLATKWAPEAVALVAVGADRHAQVLSAMDLDDAAEMRQVVMAAVSKVFEETGIARQIEEVRREVLKLRVSGT